MEKVSLRTKDGRTIKVHPVHAQGLLKQGYKLVKGQTLPSNEEIEKFVKREEKRSPLTRVQLERLNENELSEIYSDLKGVAPTIDHNKAKLVEDIIILQEKQLQQATTQEAPEDEE